MVATDEDVFYDNGATEAVVVCVGGRAVWGWAVEVWACFGDGSEGNDAEECEGGEDDFFHKRWLLICLLGETREVWWVFMKKLVRFFGFLTSDWFLGVFDFLFFLNFSILESIESLDGRFFEGVEDGLCGVRFAPEVAGLDGGGVGEVGGGGLVVGLDEVGELGEGGVLGEVAAAGFADGGEAA